MSFSSDINKFTKKVEKRGEKVFRGTVLDLFGKIIKLTPVGNPDKWKTKYKPKGYIGGRLRGNWQITLNRPADGELEVIDKTGAKTITNGAISSKKIRLSDSVFLINNVPYAQAVEDGSSGQSPHGMVKVTVAEYNRIVAANAKKVNR